MITDCFVFSNKLKNCKTVFEKSSSKTNIRGPRQGDLDADGKESKRLGRALFEVTRETKTTRITSGDVF